METELDIIVFLSFLSLLFCFHGLSWFLAAYGMFSQACATTQQAICVSACVSLCVCIHGG